MRLCNAMVDFARMRGIKWPDYDARSLGLGSFSGSSPSMRRPVPVKATLGRMTESIAKELIESPSSVVINASICLRRLEKDPPNVEGARETARRTIRDSNRAAEAVCRLRTLFYEKK